MKKIYPPPPKIKPDERKGKQIHPQDHRGKNHAGIIVKEERKWGRDLNITKPAKWLEGCMSFSFNSPNQMAQTSHLIMKSI